MRIIKNSKIIPIFDMSRALPSFYLLGNLTDIEKKELIDSYEIVLREDERRRKMTEEFIKRNFEA